METKQSPQIVILFLFGIIFQNIYFCTKKRYLSKFNTTEQTSTLSPILEPSPDVTIFSHAPSIHSSDGDFTLKESNEKNETSKKDVTFTLSGEQENREQTAQPYLPFLGMYLAL